MRFYLHFEELQHATAMTHPAISRSLRLSIATCLIAVTLSGIVINRGHAIGISHQIIASIVLADNDRRVGGDERQEVEGEGDSDGLVDEVHKDLANLLMSLILMHVTYLLLFKRPLALFMLFLHAPTKEDASS